MHRNYWILLAVLLFVLVACVFGPIHIEFVFLILAGWVIYILTTLPNVTFNWPDLALAALALFGLTLLAHWFCRWLATQLREATVAAGDEMKPHVPAWRWRWTIASVAIVVLMFATGTAMIGAVHQTTWLLTMKEPVFASPMQAARRNGSLNNLRILSLAANSHEHATARWPSGCSVDERGRLLHSWTTHLLPYLEEGLLYKAIDRDAPWDAPVNAEHFRTRLGCFTNPGTEDYSTEREFPVANYAANVRVIGGDRRRGSKHISDGLGQTILFGEVEDNCKAWGNPTNWRDPALGLGTSPEGFRGPWSGGYTIVTFADGHARIIPNDVEPQVLRALATPAGGERINDRDLEL